MTHFQQTRVLKTFFIICGEFELFIKMLNFNDRLEIYDVIKNSRDLDYYFGCL